MIRSPRQPSVEQLRAVRDALERFTGRGRWILHGAVACELPDFELRWIDPASPEPGFPIHRALASTAFFRDNRAVVCLRLDATPAALLRAVVHELQHVVDEPWIVGGRMNEALYETRARATAARLAAWGDIR